MDGTTRYFDLTNPEAPKQTYEKRHRQAGQHDLPELGRQARLHHVILLANWDKGGADNEQFVRAFNWDGKELTPAFEVDFTKEKLGARIT